MSQACVVLPDGTVTPWYGKRPPMDNDKNKVCVYQTGPLLWVSLPHDVDPALLRGIDGSHYDSSMRMYCVQAAYLYALVAALYRSTKVRTKYWPVTFEPIGLKLVCDEIVHMVVEAERIRVGEIQEAIPGWVEYNGTKPRAYQYEAARFLTTIGKAVLALPLGSGKGCTVITGLKILRERPVPVFRGAVVFCPSALKELVWRREVEKFSDMTPVVIDGTKAERMEQYAHKADVFILNPELLHRDAKEIKHIVDQASVLVVDEASILRNPESITSRTMSRLAENKQYFWLMTGTPLMNSAMELHALVDMVDPHIFRSRAEFQRRYIPVAKDGSWMLRHVTNTDELVEKVSPVMFARTPVELRQELPETTTLVEPVDLKPKQRELYDDIKKNTEIALSKYETAPAHERFLIINNVLAAMTRMKQVCNGDLVEEENPKMDRLLEMMEGDLLEDKILVFTQYETTAFKIQSAMQAAGYDAVLLSGSVKSKDRQKAVDRYQNEADCRVFIMTTAGGMGLNLTKTTAVVYYDLLWNPQMMHQIAGRAVRLGNEAPHVRIISLLARKTIEETIVKRLQEKSTTFNAIMHSEEITPDNVEGNAMFHELLAIVKSN